MTRRTVTFCAGENTYHTPDDAKTVVWNDAEQSKDALMKEALRWAAGRWPESDGEYAAKVWVEEDGEIIDSEDVTVGADGEMEFPG